jgi:hypothetical protein
MQWSIVGGLMLFILLLFGILLFQLQVPESVPVPSPPAFLLEREARAETVYGLAREEAVRWQEDAQLVSAGIVWDDLGPGGVLKRDRWTFQFYSPAQQRMAVIQIKDGQAQRLRTGLVSAPLPLLPLEEWQVDSAQAFEAWWEQGGGEFVSQHSPVSISLKLRQQPGEQRLVWSVAGSSSGQHWILQLDGSNGMVLQ